jgi:hypothetical protein
MEKQRRLEDLALKQQGQRMALQTHVAKLGQHYDEAATPAQKIKDNFESTLNSKISATIQNFKLN